MYFYTSQIYGTITNTLYSTRIHLYIVTYFLGDIRWDCPPVKYVCIGVTDRLWQDEILDLPMSWFTPQAAWSDFYCNITCHFIQSVAKFNSNSNSCSAVSREFAFVMKHRSRHSCHRTYKTTSARSTWKMTWVVRLKPHLSLNIWNRHIHYLCKFWRRPARQRPGSWNTYNVLRYYAREVHANKWG